MKKLVSLVLAVLMMACACAAFAESAPSKTVENLVVVDTVVSTTGVALPATFAVATAAVQTETSAKEIETIAAFVAENKPVVEYFGETNKAAIAALLPAGTDTTKVVMNEMMPLTVAGYTNEVGEVAVTFTCPTQYKDGQAIVAMVGVPGVDGVMVWVPQAAEVVNGAVKVTFTPDVLEVVNAGDAVLAILSVEA